MLTSNGKTKRNCCKRALHKPGASFQRQEACAVQWDALRFVFNYAYCWIQIENSSKLQRLDDFFQLSVIVFESFRSFLLQRNVATVKNRTSPQKQTRGKRGGEKGSGMQQTLPVLGKKAPFHAANPARVRCLRKEANARARTGRESWRRNGTRRSWSPRVRCRGPLLWSSPSNKLRRRRRRRTKEELWIC